jgi:CBS domain-containing protein
MARKRVHRIAISNPDKENRIEGMITGSSIVRALRDNLQVLGSLGHVPVGTLVPTGRDLVLTASATTATARECVQSLLLHSVLAMPLVDTEGAIIANFSVSDIRLLAGKSAEEAEAALGGSALDLLKGDDGRVRPPVTVMASDTLGSVIELMTSSGVHRVYIIDAARRPIGSVTVTDIIRMVLSPTLTAYGTVDTSPASEESKSADEPVSRRMLLGAKKLSHEMTALLASTTAAEFIVRDGVRIDKLVDVPAEASAMTVLRELNNNNLSAVPVYREETEAVPDLVSFIPYAYPAEKRYVGWVDAGDLCGLLLDKGLRKRTEGVLGLLKSLTRDTDRTSVAAVNYSNNDPFWAIPSERNLEQVIRVLGNCKVHRLAVVDVEEANHIVGIITQSAVSVSGTWFKLCGHVATGSVLCCHTRSSSTFRRIVRFWATSPPCQCLRLCQRPVL